MDRVLVKCISRKWKGRQIGQMEELRPGQARLLVHMKLAEIINDDDPLPVIPPEPAAEPKPKRQYRRKVQAEESAEAKPKRTYRRRDLQAED